MKIIHADEIQPGDVLVYDGYERRITRIDRRGGWSWPIAADDSGWAMALGDNLIEVQRLGVYLTPREDATPNRNVTKRELAAAL